MGDFVQEDAVTIQQDKYQPEEEDVGISGGFTCARHRSLAPCTLVHFLTDAPLQRFPTPTSHAQCPVGRGEGD